MAGGGNHPNFNRRGTPPGEPRRCLPTVYVMQAVNQRERIKMTPGELREFLEQSRVVTVASLGPNGRPHLMPLWFVLDGEDLLAWTYAASQKARNLERLPQATLQVEAGEAYGELRGVMFECDVSLSREPETVVRVGSALAARYGGAGAAAQEPNPEVRAAVERQAGKRVAIRFHPTRTVTWDHRKLTPAVN